MLLLFFCFFILKFINIASRLRKFYKNGLTTSLSLYPIMYLNELFLPYNAFLETNILSTSIPSTLNSFCFCLYRSHLFWFFCCWNLYCFHSFLYTMKKKSKRFFVIILVYVRWLYIFALCLLIWLMTTKNDVLYENH